jgi:hypothetical protein
MFKKLFGKKNRVKRLSPSASTPEGLVQSHPMYQYAMKEYAQTVPYNDNNMDGNGIDTLYPIMTNDGANDGSNNIGNNVIPASEQSQSQSQQSPSAVDIESSKSYRGGGANPTPILRATSYKSTITTTPSSDQHQGTIGSSIPMSMSKQHNSTVSYSQHHHPTSKAEYMFSNDEGDGDEESSHHHGQHNRSSNIQKQQPSHRHQQHYQYHYDQQKQQQQHHPASASASSSSPYYEPAIPDSTYEEIYGDAYIGGPMRYVYPSGYQSMRPRSGPWKLSIVVCLIFTWLSVFVIGYCSDQADQTLQYTSYNNNQQQAAAAGDSSEVVVDDDKLDIETKWCGSRLLYWMWVISMLITGLATSYCSVIGYIKLRDFAVANSRMQPTGHMGKSDYYVQLGGGSAGLGVDNPHQYYRAGGGGVGGFHHHHQQQAQAQGYNNDGYTSTLRFTNAGQPIHPANYSQTIYQADGSPQFWGNQIYRPTQAAVMITHR